MLVAALKTLLRWPLVRARLQIGERVITRTTTFVFVGNNVYGLDLLQQQLRSELARGQLCVMAAKDAGLGTLLRLAWQALRRQLEHSRDFDQWCAPALAIATHRQHLHVAIDGEVIRLSSPLHYRIHPGALLVMAPGGVKAA
jgi:diacylglycerol kinase family enzyme